MYKKILNVVVITCFLFNNFIPLGMGFEGVRPVLPAQLPLLRYLSINTANSYNYFNFLLDVEQRDTNLNQEAKKLIHYFFLGLTLAGDKIWVNLQPNQPNRVVPDELLRTEMGKTLLDVDLLLKKDVAKYFHPDNSKGKEFWTKLYDTLGIKNIKNKKIITSQRVWIVPDKARVVETEDGALVLDAKLKVLSENEYLKVSPLDGTYVASEKLAKEIILPQLTSDVNNLSQYAPLRQVYYSLILAEWFKRKVSHQPSAVSNQQNLKAESRKLIADSLSPYAPYINSGKTDGLESELPWSRDAVWQEYVQSYSKGEYKIKANLGGLNRMYFSGGVDIAGSSLNRVMEIIPKRNVNTDTFASGKMPNTAVLFNGSGSKTLAGGALEIINPSGTSKSSIAASSLSKNKFTKNLAKLFSLQGINAGKGVSFLLDSVKTELIPSLAKLSNFSVEDVLGKLKDIEKIKPVLSKFRLSQIDLSKKPKITEGDKTNIQPPFIDELSWKYQKIGDLEVNLAQSEIVVSKKEVDILDEHYSIKREEMAERDKKHSYTRDPDEKLVYRGNVAEYYNRDFLINTAKPMEDFLDINYTEKGKEVKYVVKVGIGGNEEYDHQSSGTYNSYYKDGITYVVINNNLEFAKFLERNPLAKGDNTLMIYESRSGETEEPLKVFLFNNRKDFSISIVFSNKGPLFKTAEGLIKEQRDKGETPTVLRLDFRTDVAGRYMRRKTSMCYCALHILDEIGRKPEDRITHSAEVGKIKSLLKKMGKLPLADKESRNALESKIVIQEQKLKEKYGELGEKRFAYQYMLTTDECDKDLAFTKKGKSLAVQSGEFVHKNQILGRRNQFAFITNDDGVLWGATEPLIQNWMEGVNKPGNTLLMNRYLYGDEPHAIQGILNQADSHIAFWLLRKDLPNYAEAKKKAEEMQKMGIPIIIIEMDKPSIKNTAAFQSFVEDFVVYYARIIDQDYATNPEVKYVRENSDGRLEEMADVKRENLGETLILGKEKTKETLTPKEVKIDDISLVSFGELFSQIANKLSISEQDVIEVFLKSLDGELVINAFAEANGVHKGAALKAVEKTEVFLKIVQDFNAAMNKLEEAKKAKVDKSEFIDEAVAKEQAKKLGIEEIKFSLGPPDIIADRELIKGLKGIYQDISGEDSLAKRIAEFMHLSTLGLVKDGKERSNVMLMTNNQHKLDFAKKFKESWAKNVSKLAKSIFGIGILPRYSHLIIEGVLGQAFHYFGINIFAKNLGFPKDEVLSEEDVQYSNPRHKGLDRNEALYGLAKGNDDTVSLKVPCVSIIVEEINDETNTMLVTLGREVSEHYAKILRAAKKRQEIVAAADWLADFYGQMPVKERKFTQNKKEEIDFGYSRYIVTVQGMEHQSINTSTGIKYSELMREAITENLGDAWGSIAIPGDAAEIKEILMKAAGVSSFLEKKTLGGIDLKAIQMDIEGYSNLSEEKRNDVTIIAKRYIALAADAFYNQKWPGRAAVLYGALEKMLRRKIIDAGQFDLQDKARLLKIENSLKQRGYLFSGVLGF